MMAREQHVRDRPAPPEERIMRVIRRHPTVAFVVLSFVVAWAFVPFGSFGAFGPLVAALIVVPLSRGRAGLARRAPPPASLAGSLARGRGADRRCRRGALDLRIATRAQ